MQAKHTIVDDGLGHGRKSRKEKEEGKAGQSWEKTIFEEIQRR